MPFVPVPRNLETSRCEVRKSVSDSSGVPRTLEVVTVVKGVARVQRAVDDLTRRKEERNLLLLGIHVESDRLRMKRI